MNLLSTYCDSTVLGDWVISHTSSRSGLLNYSVISYRFHLELHDSKCSPAHLFRKVGPKDISSFEGGEEGKAKSLPST